MSVCTNVPLQASRIHGPSRPPAPTNYELFVALREEEEYWDGEVVNEVKLFTAALLLYACLSAIYYAKFNPIIPDYDREYDDYFLERTVGRSARSLDVSQLASGVSWMNPRTFQFILDAISKNYET
ncbi:hypothetical protein EVAR_46613_1 [Eumeta japonica]|uniref:Uncharacterized protein n=1 Tax=Eumeta variegata TaxID=151549 RepID=A0A4C1Z9J6_EUMVA|nr:hypothetical protein EVAR_46613_1 [Eumeta japonica]